MLLGVLVFLTPFSLYLNTMAPTVYGLDSAELATGAYTLGIVHSPGSPLFLLVGRLFCYLPWGDIGWRVNLVSVTAGALTAFFVYASVYRLTSRAWIGVLSAWLLASSYYVWVWSVVAELYAPHLCIVSALVWLVLKWRDTNHMGLLWCAGILMGLGMGNHTSLVLVGPGLAWLIFTSGSKFNRTPWRLLGPAIAALTAFVGIFLYLPIRHAAGPALDYVRDYFPHINLLSIQGWIWMIRGGMFESLFFSVPMEDIGNHLLRLFAQLLANFGVLPVAISVLGIYSRLAAPPPRCHVAVAALLLFSIHSGFFVTYGALDHTWMYSVSYLTVALCFGLGLAVIADHLPSTWRQSRPKGVSVMQAIAGLLILRLALYNYPLVNLSDDLTARATGEHILAKMESHALFIGMWEHEPILTFLQLVEHQRPDVTIINGVFIGPDGTDQLAHDALHQGRPIYTTATNLFANDYTLTYIQEGLCYRVTLADTNQILTTRQSIPH